MNPALQIVEIQHSHIICDSGVDVIVPGQPNQPAGGRRRGAWETDEDEWEDEEDGGKKDSPDF
jgi:hypothetical protein